jgi:chromosome segregation ATPase
MVADRPDEPDAKLSVLDEEIADLAARVSELRRQIGERTDAPTDPEEVAQLLTEAEQQEAILATLRARRDDLKERLDQK